MSKSKSRSETSTVTDTQNLNFQDIDGVVLASSPGAQINLSDQGAIEAAFDFAGNGLGDIVDLGQVVLETSAEQQRGVFSFVGDVLRNTMNAATVRNRDFVSALSAQAARESANTDPRIEKIALVAVAIAGVVTVFAVFRGKK